MGIESIVSELKNYTDAEVFYKNCYDLRSDKKAQARYIASLNQRELKKQNHILPGQSGTRRITETDLFKGNEDKNVILTKHNRYTPAFVHYHEFFEIFFVFSGECVNIMREERFTLSAGNLCFIAPHVNHALEVFSDSIIINILIRKTAFDDIFFNLLTTNDILADFFLGSIYTVNPIEFIIFNIDDDLEIREKIYAMLIEQSRNDKYSIRIVDNLISIFFTLLIRKHGNKPLIQRTIKDINRQHYLSYINEHFRTITLAQVAKHFSVSVAHCSRLIKSQTGNNFSDLVRDIRLRHSQSLLTSTNMKIFDISYSLGYENEETFLRSFKKVFGITPSQYRQKRLYIGD